MIARIATPGDPAHQWQRFASITQALEWGRVMGVGFLTFSTLTERQAARVRNPDGQDGARLTRDERDVLLGLMHQIKRAAGALDPGRGA